jgi:hypothetical protein
MRLRKTEDQEHLSICKAISSHNFDGRILGYRLFDISRRTRSSTEAHLSGGLSPLPCIASVIRIIGGEGGCW